MNLEKMFAIQKVLRDRIAYDNPDRFDKLVLALQVELAECANEWRGFKFWSKDQEPRTKVVLKGTDGKTNAVLSDKNPLLEEYVDGLHFVLEIGLEEYKEPGCSLPVLKWNLDTTSIKYPTISKQFNKIFNQIGILEDAVTDHEWHESSEVEESYESLFGMYIGLGEMLGFTESQIEEAYLVKNAINHQRQENGY